MNLRFPEVFLAEKAKTAFIFLNFSSLNSIFCKGVHEFTFLPRKIGASKIFNGKGLIHCEKEKNP